MKRVFSAFTTLFLSFIILSCTTTEKSSIESDLITAVDENNREDVSTLIAKGADIDWIDSNGKTALLTAIIDNNLEMTEFLIRSGADISLRIEPVNREYKGGRLESTYNSALLESIESKNKDISDLLIENGAELEYELIMAVAREDREQIEYILELGADVNGKTEGGFTALHEASSVGNPELTEFLLSRGAEPDIQSNYGTTALFVAVSMQHTEVVRLLIEAGADPNLKRIDFYNPDHPPVETALIIGCKWHNREIVELLISAGTDVNWIDPNGNTALIYASIFQADLEIVRMLIDAGSDINIQNANNDTALILAARHGNTDVLELLIKNNAIIDVYEEDIESLKYYLKHEDYLNIEFLIRKLPWS